MSDAIEVEWQFEAPDLEAVARWLEARPRDVAPLVRSVGEQVLLDEYYDTADWHCHRAGYGLRLRQRDGAVEATLKTLAAAGDGPARRLEISEHLAGDARLPQDEGPVSDRVRAVAGDAPLRLLFVIGTHRRAYALGSEGRAIAELVLDGSMVAADGVPETPLRRVEIEERVPGALDELGAFIDALCRACSLVRCEGKFEAGLRIAGLRPPGA